MIKVTTPQDSEQELLTVCTSAGIAASDQKLVVGKPWKGYSVVNWY